MNKKQPKTRNLKPLSLASLIALLGLITSPAFAKVSKDIFKDFKILHADKLEFKDANTLLIGDVKIKVDDYYIEAPEVEVISKEGGSEPISISFMNDAHFESKDMEIDAKEIDVDLETDTVHCSGEPEVVSLWKDKGKGKFTIKSDYQSYNFKTGIAQASSKGEKRVVIESPDRDIESQSAKMLYLKAKGRKSSIDWISLKGNVILTEEDKRVEAQDVHYWVNGSILKASNDAKALLYSKKYHGNKEPIYLFADHMMIEDNQDILSASMKDINKQAHIFSKDIIGKARQIRLNKFHKSTDEIAFTGNAFAQYSDKAVSGQEILFDLKKKTLTSIVGRANTKLYSR